jgi:hypothetical protein
MIKIYTTVLLTFFTYSLVYGQHSVARMWNEAQLNAIRKDFARPPIHARNLWQVSMAMYDAWAAYDGTAETAFLGKTFGGFTCPFDGVPMPPDVEAARREAISYAAYRILRNRFQFSPNASTTNGEMNNLMATLGYNPNFNSTNYHTGSPAALGNYIAEQIIQFGLADGSNQQGIYENIYYQPVNPPLLLQDPKIWELVDPNRWQPLAFSIFIDQSGNEIPGVTPAFQSPEWGKVVPFALKNKDLTIYQRDANEYWVYNDPGPPCYLDTTAISSISELYKKNFSMVSIWQSHLDPHDGVLWDISPASIGKTFEHYTNGINDYFNLYNYFDGGDIGEGHNVNPYTGQAYEPQIVPRGDYARVLAEFWADGPNSETPPGHWFTILNYVNDQPELVKKFAGQGEVLDDLEWDVKTYLTLGGALHDAAITAWGIKGWYDYVRPITALRYMAYKGQSSDPNLPHYHPAGIKLVPGYIETIAAGDTLAGANGENIGKIKLFTWRGHSAIADPTTDEAGVGWILAEHWWPYQRPTFVTPPFAGYVSGHSTYSRAGAEVLTLITGSPYFPRGMGEFVAKKNEFLVFEEGPSMDVTLQWATYYDASDQCSLSRIWGGIHPPVDDITGRLLGMKVGPAAFQKALTYFYGDKDGDGDSALYDCDDNNPNINHTQIEIRGDGIDNNCNDLVDELSALATYYADKDGDGYGNAADAIRGYWSSPPNGYVYNQTDCNDADQGVHPNATEISDNGIDEDCSGKDQLSRSFAAPNPFSNALYINFNHAGSLKAYIIATDGRLVGEQFLSFEENRAEVDMSNYFKGVYFIRLVDSAGKTSAIFKVFKI